jgi:Protein of unknown function (DUF1376)
VRGHPAPLAEEIAHGVQFQARQILRRDRCAECHEPEAPAFTNDGGANNMSLPKMSLHIGDYLRETMHLSATLHGAYLLLIMHLWAKGSLPDDDVQLAMIKPMVSRWHVKF